MDPHFAHNANGPIEEQMAQMDIAQKRKKKTRHVLDASVNQSATPGFSQSQFLSQGTFSRPEAGTSQDRQLHNPVGSTSSVDGRQQEVAQQVESIKLANGQYPSVSDDLLRDEDYYAHTIFYAGQKNELNPPANVDFTALDHGVANPRFARLTMTSIPTTEEILTASHVPLSLIMQPLADLKPAEGEVPVVDCRSSITPRCHRCRTYMNPHMQFVSGGQRYTCNICGFTNETPAEYYSPADAHGRRQDWAQRPELQFGTCDFLVGKDYWVKEKEPQPAHILFAIDVSEQSLARAVSSSATAAIHEALYGPDSQEIPANIKIAIMTFDRACHFYNLDASVGSNTQMMSVPDVENMFVPLMHGLFVDPVESRATIESTLATIGSIFREDKTGVPEPAVGAVMRAAYLALAAVGGGKLSLFLGALPTWGPGKLRVRDTSAMYGTPEERTLFDAADIHWKNIADEFVGIGVGVDCFFFPNAYIDLATIGWLSQTTGGDIFYYSNFYRDRDGTKFVQELQRSLSRTQGTAVQMKLRCSNGLRVDSIIGQFVQKGPSDLEMGCIDADKAVTFILKHDGKLAPQSDVFFQSAILFTTPQGQRILRTHNIKCGSTSSITEVLRFCDAGAVVATIAKAACLQVLKMEPKAVKQTMTDHVVRILAAYRKNSAKNIPPGELIMPPALHVFPLFVLAAQKQFSFRTDPINSDVRVNNQRIIKRSSVRDILSLIYPRIIALHTLRPEEGFADEAGHFRMPPAMSNTFMQIEAGGAYLCDDGQNLILWLHKDVVPALLQDLFGQEYTTLDMIKPRSTKISTLDTLLNTQVRNIIHYLNTYSTSRHLIPQIVRQSYDHEALFANALVDDRGCDNAAYPDFLKLVHKRVQLILAESQTTSSFGGWLSGTEQAY